MKNGNDIKSLFLITEEYPFGYGEPFIENEIKSLSLSFNKVIIISKGDNSLPRRIVPENVEIVNFNYLLSFTNKLFSLRFIFTRVFLSEHLKIKTNISKIGYSLISLHKANTFSRFVRNNFLPSEINNSIFYTYWCMDETIGICLYLKNDKNKCITRAHGYDLYFERSKYKYLPFRSLISKNIDAIFPISNQGQDYLKNSLRLNFKRITTSYLGTHQTKSIDQINVDSFAYKVLTCSNIYPNKRVELVAKSIYLMKTKIDWDHYGDFLSFVEDEYKIYLSSLFDKLSEKRIKFNLKGKLKNKDLLNMIKKNKYDLFLLLSSSEGLPVSIMEAFSFGIPVIATNVGGVSEIVENNINGFLLEKNCSENDITKKIEEFYKLDISDVNKLKINAYKTWENKFNAKENFSSFVKTLHEL